MVQNSLGCNTKWKIMDGMLYGRKFGRSGPIFKFQLRWYTTHCFYNVLFDLTRKSCCSKLSALKFSGLKGYGLSLVTKLSVTLISKIEFWCTVINSFWVGVPPWQCFKVSRGSSRQQLKKVWEYVFKCLCNEKKV